MPQHQPPKDRLKNRPHDAAAAAMEQAAALLEEQAQNLRASAWHRRNAAHGQNRLLERLDQIRTEYGRGGLDGAAKALGAAPEALAPIIKQITLDDAQAKRQARNRAICGHARQGWSDREIAEKFGLARGTVNRIVKTGFRQWPANAPDVDL